MTGATRPPTAQSPRASTRTAPASNRYASTTADCARTSPFTPPGGVPDFKDDVATDSNDGGINFSRWDVARAKPHRYLNSVLVAVIPGEFPSIDPSIGMVTTTHAQLRLSGSWPGSTIEYGKGTWDTQPSTYLDHALPNGEPFPNDVGLRIALDAASKNTYVWVRVTNGGPDRHASGDNRPAAADL